MARIRLIFVFNMEMLDHAIYHDWLHLFSYRHIPTRIKTFVCRGNQTLVSIKLTPQANALSSFNYAIATYSVGDFPGILFRNLSRLLQDEVEGPAVHVLHADVDLAVARSRK